MSQERFPHPSMAWLIALCVLGVSIVFAIRLAIPYWTEHRAANNIRSLGGLVSETTANWPVVNRGTKLWFGWEYTNITSVTFRSLDPASLSELPEPLSRLPQLKTLVFESTEFTPETLAILLEATRPTQLMLVNCSLRDQDFAGLRTINGLRHLSLSGCPVEDGVCDWIASHPELRHLNLDGTNVTITGLRKLKSLRQLEVVTLSNTGLTDAEINELRTAHPSAEIDDD